MSHNKKKPKKIASEFVARASGKLEKAVAEELKIEDPAPEEAEAVIEELTVEEEEEETLPNGNPIRHRGPKT